MLVLRPGQRHVMIPGDAMSVHAGRNTLHAGGAVWWLSGGIAAADCLAAYTPKGAASLAASYDNNAAPGNGLADGTYDAAPGTAPTFDANGWTFNGTDQWLTTASNFPISGASARTIIAYVQLLAAPAWYANVGAPALGNAGTGQNFELLADWSRRLYGWGTGRDVQGTVAMTLSTWYPVAFSYNGTTSKVRTGATTNSADHVLDTITTKMRIAKDASNRYGNVLVKCAALYDKELSDAEWSAISTAMAAL